NPRLYSLPMGTNGFMIDCAGCGKKFESRGLRCCSADCECDRRRQQDLEIELEGSPRAIKPRCRECGASMKLWRKGRRVSTARKFCSSACQQRHSRKRRMGDSPRPKKMNGETQKMSPENRLWRKPSESPEEPILKRHHPPVNILGGYRFSGAPEI